MEGRLRLVKNEDEIRKEKNPTAGLCAVVPPLFKHKTCCQEQYLKTIKFKF